MKTVAIIAARMGSTRLPGKVLMPLGHKPVVAWVVDAAARAPGVDEVWVATTTEPADDDIEDYFGGQIEVYRGSATDVLSRYVECAAEAQADVVVRLTGDCPFADPEVIGGVVALQRRTGAAYAQNVSPATWPDGLDVEVFTRDALKVVAAEATRPSDRDCLTQYLERNRTRFPNAAYICPIPGLHRERWVLDTEDDLAFCRGLYERLPAHPTWLDILNVLDIHPELRKINSRWQRNERFYETIANE